MMIDSLKKSRYYPRRSRLRLEFEWCCKESPECL